MKGFRLARTLLLLGFLSSSLILHAQAARIFSPFPSSLRAVESGEGILLSWRDSSDVLGTYHVFRHNEEITEKNFSQARKIGSVPPGISSFVDYPKDEEGYYYAVLLENPEGGLFKLFISFRNKTVYPVAARPVVAEKDLASVITALNAEVSGEEVILHFSTDRNDRTLSIYRHTDPIADVDDLLNASSIAMIDSSQTAYTDYPIPGIPYYYGVFDTKLIQSGTFIFSPGQNISTLPVKIGENAQRTGLAAPNAGFRSPPLPRLMLQRSVVSGNDLAPSVNQITPAKRPLDPSTQEIVDKLLAGLPHDREEEVSATILPVHLYGDFTGASYTLSLILKEQFLKGDYRETAASLEKFLSIKRESVIDCAARFYLGQAYYFTQNYREALFQFFTAETDYYAESQPWIDRIYPHLAALSPSN